MNKKIAILFSLRQKCGIWNWMIYQFICNGTHDHLCPMQWNSTEQLAYHDDVIEKEVAIII